MTNLNYTDEELRFRTIELAVQLVNTEVQRVNGQCNTKHITVITNELANIIRYGQVDKPEYEIVNDVPVVDSPIPKAKGKTKAKEMKYA